MAQVFNAQANAALPDVAIQIGGRERPMSFCFRAINALEDKHKQSVGWLIANMDQLHLAVDLLHAALWPDDQTLTIEEVTPWVSFLNLAIIQNALLAAWFGSIPEKQPGEAKARSRKSRRAK